MKTIAFTLGHEESYDRYLREQAPNGPRKLGAREVGSPDEPNGYRGGTVWKTSGSARNYIEKNNLIDFSVYSIQMLDEFEKCAKQNEDGNFDLLVDCLILRKEKLKKEESDPLLSELRSKIEKFDFDFVVKMENDFPDENHTHILKFRFKYPGRRAIGVKTLPINLLTVKERWFDRLDKLKAFQ